jgi:hypothetical protein
MPTLARFAPFVFRAKGNPPTLNTPVFLADSAKPKRNRRIFYLKETGKV